jgi:predicted lipoprotein with Yx(FWY)xxD motif
MNIPTRHTALVFGALMASAFAAHAEGILAAPNGMTLYTFDKDTGGTSACDGDCAVKWPPFAAMADEKMPADWTQITRTDGTMQWAYDGKPVYFFKSDTKKGDMAGDGLGGVWHVIKE